MAGGKTLYAAGMPRPPLFHRFEASAPTSFTREELQASILEELNRLFLSRSAFSLKDAEAVDPLLIDYRHPALYGADNASVTEAEAPKFWPQMADALQKKISLYEPRLLSPRVEVVRFDKENQHLEVAISGDVLYAGIREGIVIEMASPLASVRAFGDGGRP